MFVDALLSVHYSNLIDKSKNTHFNRCFVTFRRIKCVAMNIFILIDILKSEEGQVDSIFIRMPMRHAHETRFQIFKMCYLSQFEAFVQFIHVFFCV